MKRPAAAGSTDGTPVLLIGHAPDEHGVLREVLCGAPRPIACRVCKGEQDCPYVESRSAFRLRVRHRVPTDPVAPVSERTVGTGMDTAIRSGWSRLAVGFAAALAWGAVVGLALLRWVVDPVSPALVSSVLGLKLAVFVFAVVGVPLVRLTWAGRGGRFRRSDP